MKTFFVILLTIVITFLSHSLDYKVHSLKEGETLWRISKLYNIPLDKLCKFNNINDVTKVKKGAKIKIPDNKTTKESTNTKVVKKANNDNSDKNSEKNYLNFNLPVKGDIKPFITSHFRGIIIFSDLENEILSIDNGEVSFSGVINGYGNTVIIKNSKGFIFTYSGFSDLYVKKGDKIDKSKKIGISGQLSRYSRNGILLSIQHKDIYLKFDMNNKKFYL